MGVELPDVVYDQLRGLLDQKEVLQWEIGDFIVDVWQEVKRYVPEDERRKEHARFLKDLAYHTGTHYGSLRNMEVMSEFYSTKDRKAYIPPLTWSHLRACLSAGEDWETWARWAVDNQASADAIRAERKGAQTAQDRERELLRRLETLMIELVEMTKDAEWVVIHTIIKDKTNAEKEK